MITLTLTEAQVTCLRDLVDAENVATKNRLVDAVLSTGDYKAHADSLARASRRLLALRADLARALDGAK